MRGRVRAALKDEALAAALGETAAQVLIVRSTKVTAAMLDAGHLALIVRAGAGYNTIDVADASARGIYVSNCPGKNAIAVAELAFGLILALDRRIPDNVAELRAGSWNKKEFSKAAGLFGRTLGLLGFGSIGQEVARRAQAFGLDLVIWSRRFAQEPDRTSRWSGWTRRAATSRVTIAPSPQAVADQADILSVHLALAPDTQGLVSADVLGAPEAGRDVHQHGAGRGRGLRRARGGRAGSRAPRRPRRVPDEPSGGTGSYADPLLQAAGRLRHAPHRRVHRAGAGGHRGRNRPHRPRVQGHRPGAERGEPRTADARDAHAGRAPPRPPRRAGARVRAPARRAHQRAGNREHHLRGRRRPPSPASTSTARRPTTCSRASRRATTTSSARRS